MITKTEYAKRRSQLMQALGENSIAILPAANEIIRNGDSHYPFRQNSDFYYLTGFNEPEAMLVLIPKRAEGEFILFNRKRDPEREVWDGKRAGQKGACDDYAADQAFAFDDWQKELPKLLAGRETLYYPIGHYAYLDAAIMQIVNDMRAKVRRGVKPPKDFVDVLPLVHEMRVTKSDNEVALMQKAVDISAAGHVAVMQACGKATNECELDAIVSYEFMRRGAKFPAYTSIVGAGANSCVLHYVQNDQAIRSGDLVLVDAGAEYAGYAADITRTFPANGKFSEEQRAIYEIVLRAQQAGIEAIKPGAIWSAPQAAILKILTQGLIDVGILRGKLDDLLKAESYAPFYMHGSGHWLGLDVHDAGSYKLNDKWRPFEIGMTLTVEPGLYIAASDKVEKRWHNIGVRIEDDVLVTAGGCKVLSAAIPKSVSDVEALMRS